MEFVRTPKARRYILRMRPDGTLRVTIPRRGTRVEATAFVARHLAWIARERERLRREQSPVRWTHGTTILFEGSPHVIGIERGQAGWVARYADRLVPISSPEDARREIEADLRALARERLIPRLCALAAQQGLKHGRVSIRAQRSRWGSCSRSGAIALNFRLVQMPAAVADYVLIHELMHLQQQNHGPRFWALVERACPDYENAERWLRRTGRTLF